MVDNGIATEPTQTIADLSTLLKTMFPRRMKHSQLAHIEVPVTFTTTSPTDIWLALHLPETWECLSLTGKNILRKAHCPSGAATVFDLTLSAKWEHFLDLAREHREVVWKFTTATPKNLMADSPILPDSTQEGKILVVHVRETKRRTTYSGL